MTKEAIDDLKREIAKLRIERDKLTAEIKEYNDALSVCTNNFSCKTFVPQKWELPPYTKQGKGTPIQ